MKSFIETIHFNRCKEDNWVVKNKANELGFKSDELSYLGYEVSMEVEIFEDGSNRVLKIDGNDVSKLNIKI